jgi:hypothetical protein
MDARHIAEHVSLEQGWASWSELLPFTGERRLWEYGAKVFSQNCEDGILHRIFSEIGTTSKNIVEIGAGDGIECMAANLILNHGFSATLMDGSDYWLMRGIKEYHKRDPKLLERVNFCHAWFTRENVVEILKNYGATGECDLFSLDIDGIDYYVLKSIMDAGVLRPRVMVLEYQDILGPTSTQTVAYDPAFDHRRYDCWNGPNYCGASLGAFSHLLNHSYAFVGCEGLGFNAFFVRRDLLTSYLTEMRDVTPCFALAKVAEGMRTRAPRTAHLPWVDVTAM